MSLKHKHRSLSLDGLILFKRDTKIKYYGCILVHINLFHYMIRNGWLQQHTRSHTISKIPPNHVYSMCHHDTGGSKGIVMCDVIKSSLSGHYRQRWVIYWTFLRLLYYASHRPDAPVASMSFHSYLDHSYLDTKDYNKMDKRGLCHQRWLVVYKFIAVHMVYSPDMYVHAAVCK